MKQVFIASDIHLEFYKKPEEYPALVSSKKEDSILILAGDVVTHNQVNKTADWWKHISNMFDHVLYVPGNHDYYGSSIDKGLPRHRRIFESLPNVHLLQNEVINIDGVDYFGSTLWTDLNRNSYHDTFCVKKGMSDFTYIDDFTIDIWLKENEKARDAMFSKLANSDRPVIITHHLPDYNFVDERFKGTSINAGFANTQLFDRILNVLNPRLYVFGHTHYRRRSYFGDTTVICNAVGYVHREYDFVTDFKLESTMI